MGRTGIITSKGAISGGNWARILGWMSVERIGRSYALSISYSSPSPALSAGIAAAIADAYLVDKLNSKY